MTHKNLWMAAACTMLAGTAIAEDGNWMVRGRIINLTPSNDGGESSIGGKPYVGGDTMPELDVTYFLTDSIAFELIAATTQHKAKVNKKPTTTDLGDVWLLPPTLTAQYHWNCDNWFAKPYVGAGITYAHFYDADTPVGINSVKYDDAFGFALQAGADYKLTDNVYLNADVKKIFLSTDVTVNDTITAKANLNPVVAGIGIGYRF
ncbi:MAG: OmpW family protein [Alphaproteobacteria bacterium CG_4_10_14_0_8_um_filter_53_9]|nr:MAG: OmpW family protein [Alphaproteobacteria bacterium CG_4_10_14_0_8_um_filter_53_9]